MDTKKYKYITIRPMKPDDFGIMTDSPKTEYTVLSNRPVNKLGLLSYNLKWKCYEFEPAENAMFTADCLTDIVDFMTNHAGK